MDDLATYLGGETRTGSRTTPVMVVVGARVASRPGCTSRSLADVSIFRSAPDPVGELPSSFAAWAVGLCGDYKREYT